MVSKAKMSVLAAVAAAAAFASQSEAATLNLDLRFVPTGTTTGSNVQPGGVSADGKTAILTPADGGTYDLQVWAQITDPTHTFTTDGVGSLAFRINSALPGAPTGALNGGGVSSVTLSSVTNTSGNINSANNPANNTVDSVADWGGSTTATSAPSFWITWGNSGSGGYHFGTAQSGVSQAIQGNADGWEILIASLTINATSLVTQDVVEHDTNFTIGAYDKRAAVPSGTSSVENFTLNGVAKASQTSPTLFSVGGVTLGGNGLTTGSGVITDGPGVSFILLPVPEPASMGVLALGGLALLARRRRA